MRNTVRPGQAEVTLTIAATRGSHPFCCPACRSSKIDPPASRQACEPLMASQEFAGRIGWFLVIGRQEALSSSCHVKKLPGLQSLAGGEGVSFCDPLSG